MKRFIQGILVAGMMAIAGSAGAICTLNTTGLRLEIPNFGDNFSVWAKCMRSDFQIINDSAVPVGSTPTLAGVIWGLTPTTGTLTEDGRAIAHSIVIGDGLLEQASLGLLDIRMDSNDLFGLIVSSADLSTMLSLDNAGQLQSSGDILLQRENVQPTFRGRMFRDAQSGFFSSRVELQTANGTIASSSALTSGQVTGSIRFIAYDGGSFQFVGARIRGRMEENATPTTLGQSLEFRIVPSGTAAESTAMTLDQTGFLGIGAAVPGEKLDVSGGNIRTVRSGAAATLIAQSFKDGGTHSGDVRLQAARGTSGSPTATLSGDVFGTILFRGHDELGFQGSGTGSSIAGLQTETTCTSSVCGSQLRFSVVPNGQVSRVQALLLDQDLTALFANKVRVVSDVSLLLELNNSDSAEGAFLMYTTPEAPDGFNVGVDDTGLFRFQDGGTGSNIVSIATKTDSSSPKLDVMGTSGVLFRASIGGAPGDEKFDILASGFIGVGTTAPATKFHLSSGTVLVDGTGAALQVTGLVSCDTIDTSSAGAFSCGTDANTNAQTICSGSQSLRGDGSCTSPAGGIASDDDVIWTSSQTFSGFFKIHGGNVIKSTMVTTCAEVSGSVSAGYDSSAPQVSEVLIVLESTFTPTNVANKIRVYVNGSASNGSNVTTWFSLFDSYDDNSADWNILQESVTAGTQVREYNGMREFPGYSGEKVWALAAAGAAGVVVLNTSNISNLLGAGTICTSMRIEEVVE